MILGATVTAYSQGMRHVAVEVFKDNSHLSDTELQEMIAKALIDTPSVQEEVMIYAAVNLVNNCRRLYPAPTQPTPAAVSATNRAAVRAVKEQIKTQLRLLFLVCPNGKLLKDCTYGECVQFGGWFIKLGRGKDPDCRVQESEAQLRELQTWAED